MDIREESVQAFRRLASGVSVISAGNRQEKYALTASSVTSVSMDPPSLLVCIHKQSEIIDFLEKQDHLCVNLLSQSEEHLSNICATPGAGDKRFTSSLWKKNALDTPYVEGAQANFFCEIDKRTHYTTHNIYIARIIDVKYKQEINPLVYMNSQYGSFCVGLV